jgi:hypothetical protein
MSERPERDDAAGKRALRRLLQAAAADESTVELGEFFAPRVAARAATTPPPAPVVVLAAAAWRLLPALAVLALAVTAWGTYETTRLQHLQESSLAQAAGGEGGDALLAALLLGTGAVGSAR